MKKISKTYFKNTDEIEKLKQKIKQEEKKLNRIKIISIIFLIPFLLTLFFQRFNLLDLLVEFTIFLSEFF